MTLKFSLLISCDGDEHSIPHAKLLITFLFVLPWKVAAQFFKSTRKHREHSPLDPRGLKMKSDWNFWFIHSAPPRHVVLYLHTQGSHFYFYFPTRAVVVQFAKDLSRFMFIFIRRHMIHSNEKFLFSSRRFRYPSSECEMWIRMCCVVELDWVASQKDSRMSHRLKKASSSFRSGERRRKRHKNSSRPWSDFIWRLFFLLPIARLLWVLYSYTFIHEPTLPFHSFYFSIAALRAESSQLARKVF